MAKTCRRILRPGRRQLLTIALVGLLLAACGGSGGGKAVGTTPPTTAPVERDYWPTAGWRTADPKAHGIDPAGLAKIDQDVTGGYNQVRSVLVVRHGYLVYERYWEGADPVSGHDLRSVTKSVTGALVGIALGEGHIKSVQQTVEELLAKHLPADADPRLRQVTVEQLLTMTSGLASDDPSLGGDYSLDKALFESRDWVKHILGRRLETDPGTTWAYSNASSHLLSAIVADATGQSMLAYARAKLFGPLGINTDGAFEPVVAWDIPAAILTRFEQARFAWAKDPQGYHEGAGGLKLPARDLAKFGYLYLNGGRWDGEQVVPADYVRTTTAQEGSSPNIDQGYGQHWWVEIWNGHRTFRAQGYGGQFVHVVPDLDLVTVITSDVDMNRNDAKVLIDQDILPAVTGH
jgi:CubicO group peptidase (beta-lactamase class C family)